MMVNERTGLQFFDFFLRKNGKAEPACEQFNCWRQGGKKVKYLWMDNMGENKLLQACCKSKDWKVDLEDE